MLSGCASDLLTFVTEIGWVRRVNQDSHSDPLGAMSGAIEQKSPRPHSSPGRSRRSSSEKWEARAKRAAERAVSLAGSRQSPIGVAQLLARRPRMLAFSAWLGEERWGSGFLPTAVENLSGPVEATLREDVGTRSVDRLLTDPGGMIDALSTGSAAGPPGGGVRLPTLAPERAFDKQNHGDPSEAIADTGSA